jgi:transcriptional regulator NrdR family protein
LKKKTFFLFFSFLVNRSKHATRTAKAKPVAGKEKAKTQAIKKNITKKGKRTIPSKNQSKQVAEKLKKVNFSYFCNFVSSQPI